MSDERIKLEEFQLPLLVEGTPEAKRHREACRFLKLPYDLKEANVQRGIAAWKQHNHELMEQKNR